LVNDTHVRSSRKSMRLSWFRPDPRSGDDAADGIAHLITGLAPHHEIGIIDRVSAHDHVWRVRRGLVDLTVYELTGGVGDAYMWPYLVRFPGLALILGRQAVSAHRSHLVLRGRRSDADAERAFSRESAVGSLAIPLACSRLVAVPAGSAADSRADATSPLRTFDMAMARPPVIRLPRAGVLRVGMISPDAASQAAAERAAARARAAGAAVELVHADDASHVLARADVLLSIVWPPAGGLTGDVLAAQALGIPGIVMESPDTAGLPCLDAQTWQSRDRGPGAPLPVAVSLDPRDQEHSLMLALLRLAAEEQTLAALGEAATRHWARFHEPSRAVGTFIPLLDAAGQAAAPVLPAGWPAHFRADASGTARQVLGSAGLTVDIL